MDYTVYYSIEGKIVMGGCYSEPKNAEKLSSNLAFQGLSVMVIREHSTAMRKDVKGMIDKPFQE